MEKLKTIILTLSLMAIPSCASYKNTTLRGCFPEDRESKTKKEITSYIANPDTTFHRNSILKRNISKDPDYFELRFNFWEF